MRNDTLSSRKLLASVLLFCAFGASAASAQTAAGQAAGRQPERAQSPVARESESACGGFIEQNAQAASGQLVGGVEEIERQTFAQGDTVYIDAGAQAGVRAGQEFAVVRPRGRYSSKFSRKGTLGVFVQEVGRLRVVRVRDRVSVAEVILSCTDLRFGDLLRPYVRAEVPEAPAAGPLDRFAEPSGKQTGRIVLARDGREQVSQDDVVYVDLGAEDNLRVGDRLTVYRPKGHGTMVESRGDVAANHREGFQSDELRGGGFSIQSLGVSDVNGSKSGSTVKVNEIKRRRPPVPRKVVGELVVIRVDGRAATAVVTRVAQEIYTGDAVEVQ